MQFNTWNYQGEFLNQFENNSHKNLTTQMFCTAVGNENKTEIDVLDFVYTDVELRLKSEYLEAPARLFLEKLRSVLDTNEAVMFARFILWREQLPAAEREALKKAAASPHVETYMSGQKPSEKLLSYLQSLGCSIVPQTKLEASRLIDQFLKQKKAA